MKNLSLKFIRLLMFFFFSLICQFSFASNLKTNKDSLYVGTYYNEINKVYLYLDLLNHDLLIPQYEFFGKTSGFMKGKKDTNLYSIWFITSFTIKNNDVELKFTNDTGAYSQTTSFQHIDNNTYKLYIKGKNELTKREGNKLVKIPIELTFKKLSTK